MYSVEVTKRISDLRVKERDKTLTQEDMKEVVKLLRSDRMNAATASAKSRAKGPVKSAEQLLDELDAM
jgi:hypothetical protein